MKLFDLYGWALPNTAAILAPYKDNEQMTKLIKNFMTSLQSCALWFLLLAVILSIVLFAIYYWPYNNKPGRHYKCQKWASFAGVLACCMFVSTVVICAFLRCPIAALWWKTTLMIALINTLYSVLLYLLCSFILCQIPSSVSKTNAYLFMKIGRR